MTKDSRKLCFVVMGFGIKPDLGTGRALNLDATYEWIIKPAVEKHNLRCVRADEVLHSGLIDLPMYEMLLRADLVIADISTGNTNAVYELGVRHALRPRSTIIMKEKEGALQFDLNHINTLHYEHLGKDIGASEAARVTNELQALIGTVLATNTVDSPIYTVLPNLQQPALSEEQFDKLVDEVEQTDEVLRKILHGGEQAIAGSNFTDAVAAFSEAIIIKPNDSYLLQRLALSTYKAGIPSEIAALFKALEIINQLSPDKSNDPETLGLAGAINKRIWESIHDITNLELAIKYYRKGWEVSRDYYNGENLANCYKTRGELAAADEKIYYDFSARKTRIEVIKRLEEILADPSFNERSDIKWIYATLANCNFHLNNSANGIHFEEKFMGQNPSEWEIETYRKHKPT
jgi:tetratricopeptide (TPR) repeat protein